MNALYLYFCKLFYGHKPREKYYACHKILIYVKSIKLVAKMKLCNQDNKWI